MVNPKNKLEAIISAVHEYGGTVHGDWRNGGGGTWLDVEFPNVTTAILCASNFGDLSDGIRPRDAIHSFTASLVVEIPLEPGDNSND